MTLLSLISNNLSVLRNNCFNAEFRKIESIRSKMEHSSILSMGPASVFFLSFLIRHQARDKDSGSFGQITYSLEGDSSRWVMYIYIFPSRFDSLQNHWFWGKLH